MKLKKVVGRSVVFRFTVFLTPLWVLFLAACEPDENRLGVDIFPSQDTIIVFADTITDIETRLVRSRPRITSVNEEDEDRRLFLLGSLVDSMTGLSRAEIVSEFGLSVAGDFGANPSIDSLSLWFYVSEVVGDTTEAMHIRVYEFLDTLSMQEDYYSDYDVSGKYNPEPLVDETFVPEAGTTVTFKIDNPDLLSRIRQATDLSDSTFFYNASFQELFRGLYITTEPVSEGGVMAKLQMANDLAGLRFRYYHDSIDVSAYDTLSPSTYTFTFNEFNAQKINIFHHDFSGTSLEEILDDPDAEPPIAYAQGMAGVNVRLSIPDLANYIGTGQIAINTARLLFYVLPDSISGIPQEAYPDQLMMEAQLVDGTVIPVYDDVINTNNFYFGKLSQSNETSAFLPSRYYYNFNVGRHFQSMINGEIDNAYFYIFIDKPEISTDIIKFWSNYSGSDDGLRLELIYSKFD